LFFGDSGKKRAKAGPSFRLKSGYGQDDGRWWENGRECYPRSPKPGDLGHPLLSWNGRKATAKTRAKAGPSLRLKNGYGQDDGLVVDFWILRFLWAEEVGVG
jgi:hypothetical protein